MKVTKTIHPIWKEGAHKILGHKLVGKWHHHYESSKGYISLIKIYGYPIGDKRKWDSHMWEIYGDGIEDVERYKTKKSAEKRIKEILE